MRLIKGESNPTATIPVPVLGKRPYLLSRKVEKSSLSDDDEDCFDLMRVAMENVRAR